LIQQYRSYLVFLGDLSPAQMADFFALCDVVTVASDQTTRNLRLVQVDGILVRHARRGTDLPGVRQPVKMTGMGEIVPPADSEGLATRRVEGARRSSSLRQAKAEVVRLFDMERTVDQYERLFQEKRAG